MLANIFLLTGFLTTFFLCVSLVISKKANYDLEKASPFECGFNPTLSARTPFSLQFFLITLIFLIFDVELILLFPVLWSLLSELNWVSIMNFSIMVMILSLGFILEWNQSMLEWKI